MDRCTGRHDITEILLKTALNTMQSINLLMGKYLSRSGEYRSSYEIERSDLDLHSLQTTPGGKICKIRLNCFVAQLKLRLLRATLAEFADRADQDRPVLAITSNIILIYTVPC